MEYTSEVLEELKKLNENLAKLHEPKMFKIGDVARILKINNNQASKLFKRADFPALTNCGDNKIEQTALFNWLQTRHADYEENDDESEI